ncbi:hypothetical protein [Methylobacterium indicum]|uniref:hypothetical protein n=1 Tax=Methylobacterium indicum TaxID=1775910 RepID=UPI001A91E4F9|nr:hypothetical protein [Methylobacterium indicum]
MKALIIDDPWIGLILCGEKTWEMRRTACRQTGRIGLIRKGSKQVVGVADLAGSLPPLDSAEAYRAAEPKHRIPADRQARAFADGWRRPWLLGNAQPLERPVPYAHRSGAVIWVNLDPAVAEAVAAQIGVPRAPQPKSEPQSQIHQAASKRPPPTVLQPASGRRLRIQGWIDGDVAYLPLSQGNIRNNHFYLRSILDFFPPDGIGGSDETQRAARPVTVRYQPGTTVETDIAGENRANSEKRSSHYFFRNRSPIKDFFARSGAQEGDTLVIRRENSHSYTVTLEKTSAV